MTTPTKEVAETLITVEIERLLTAPLSDALLPTNTVGHTFNAITSPSADPQEHRDIRTT